MQVHGHVRMTNDLDLIPAPDRANLGRLTDALHELGARVLNRGSEGLAVDVSMLPRATLWQFSTRLGDIDLLHDAPGAAAFDELRARALVISLGDQRIPVAGRDDLIRMKRASGRTGRPGRHRGADRAGTSRRRAERPGARYVELSRTASS